MKVLIAGFGSVGRRHFRNLAALSVHDVSFYRSSLSTLPTDEIGGCKVFSDLEEAISAQPTAVIVANPTALHVPVATAAALAGVDYFVEKPLSASRAGCEDLLRLSEERSLVTMVGCQYRFHPLLRRLREQLMREDFGVALSAKADYGDSLLHWHPWEDHRHSYSARIALGGGAILTLIHPLDYLYWLFGRVRDVHASTRKAAFLETDVLDDIADLTLEFDSGVLAHVHVDFVQTPPVHTLVVVCERGRASLDFIQGTLRWQGHGEGELTQEHVPEGYERNAMFIDEMRHFLACVQDRTPTDIPLADGLAVLDLALKAKSDAERRQG